MNIEQMRRNAVNAGSRRMENAKPCPFCGSTSVNAIHTEQRFIGKNCYGVNKIHMKCYCVCNKCRSRSKPISYVGYSSSRYGTHIYDDSFKEKALDEWNRRN